MLLIGVTAVPGIKTCCVNDVAAAHHAEEYSKVVLAADAQGDANKILAQKALPEQKTTLVPVYTDTTTSSSCTQHDCWICAADSSD